MRVQTFQGAEMRYQNRSRAHLSRTSDRASYDQVVAIRQQTQPSGRPTTRRNRPNAAWLPQQHGAWFILSVPILAGWILRLRAGQGITAELAAIAFCWVSGYLAFNAALLRFKLPINRRRPATIALVVWSCVAAGCGAVAVSLGGLEVAAWVMLFGPLTAAALWLAARRRERSVLSGALSTAAASSMTLVSRFGPMSEFVAALGTPTGTTALLLSLMLFGYLFGTVLHVKTMIRQRGKRSWLLASLLWHGTATALVAIAASCGLISWAWPMLWVAITLRAWLLPRSAARHPIRPLLVGIVEIGICSALLLLTAFA